MQSYMNVQYVVPVGEAKLIFVQDADEMKENQQNYKGGSKIMGLKEKVKRIIPFKKLSRVTGAGLRQPVKSANLIIVKGIRGGGCRNKKMPCMLTGDAEKQIL